MRPALDKPDLPYPTNPHLQVLAIQVQPGLVQEHGFCLPESRRGEGVVSSFICCTDSSQMFLV